MNDDAVLLRRYVEHASEEAFTALVRRHIDLVYSAALRRTGGDPHRAADVAQDVFTALARQARALSNHPVLGAWLHAATRNIAVNLMVSDQRRKQRHRHAMALGTVQTVETVPEWDRLRPVLDAAIDELPERERLPVVMRFLERRPFKEIGAALTISEDAARVRTDRALEKLRRVLVRRGITSTAEALATVVSVHAIGGAPSGLAETMAAESLAVGTATGATTATSILVVGKLVATAAVSALFAFGLGVLMAENRATTSTSAASGLPQPTLFSSLTEENQRLQAELQRLNADVDGLETVNAKLMVERASRAPANPVRAGRVIGLPLQRHEIEEGVRNNFSKLAAAQDHYKLEHGRWPSSIHDLVGATNYIRGIKPVDGEDYSALLWGGRTFRLTTRSGITIAYANDEPVDTNSPEFRLDIPPEVTHARELEKKLADAKQAATEAYRLANRGKNPPNEKALIAFFANPQEGADFVEYLEAKKNLPD